ncbi:probable secreted glycoprotein [Natronomonas moolapensis 8.8.11]|uniref:Probable secreted glycoprotein n=1 Tax=Natronomonas moolapensis (strain DSM 18674 / CECT 7526 / JCM 14361 / 8.8.11) TaxID=268739 RepID=M1XT07_NATM8|nr:PGF-CTERM sorting domain-containing protein [Natronomonas moolapensis]CCQ37541.1 probable secreted glycoprotein [Natronomonas moolapensis 8.8.11]
MNTRTLLAGFFVVALIGSAVVGTGAGDIFSGQDEVEESVTLSPADTPEGDAYASTTDAGELSVTIDGLPQNAQTDVDDVFNVSFDSPTSPTAKVLINESESNDNVDFVVTDASNAAGVQSGADIDDSRVELESGESVLVGVELDGTSGGDVTIEEITADVELDAGDLAVTFDNNVIAAGDGQTQATATTLFEDGVTEDRTADAEFSSNDTDVVEVDDDGTITAGEAGTATITAELDAEDVVGDEGVTAEAEINVGLITDLDVELADDRVRFGSGVSQTETTAVDSVTATLADGTTTDVTNDTDLTVAPADGDAELVDVNDLTIAPTEDATGTATIQAELQGESDAVDVTAVRRSRATVDADEGTASFDGTERIDSITFEGVDLQGSETVEIEESDQPPDEEDLPDNIDPATSVTITDGTSVTVDDENEDESANLTARVPTDEVNRGDIVVIRLPDDGGSQRLDPYVGDPVDDKYVVKFETPGFSTFVLGGTTTEPSGGGGGGGGSGGGSFGGGGLSPSVSVSTGVDVASGGTVELGRGTVESIRFEEATQGTLEIDDYGTSVPPGSAETGDRPVLASADITAPDSVSDSPATIRMTVDQTELLRTGVDADELAILRETDTRYQTLDTSVAGENGDVTLEARTPGFSTFIVTTDEGDIVFDTDADTPVPDDGGTPVPGDGAPADDDATETPDTEATETPDTEATETPDTEATETPEPESLPGFGAAVAVVALLAAALLAARRRTDG